MKHLGSIIIACIWILVALFLVGILVAGIGGRFNWGSWKWGWNPNRMWNQIENSIWGNEYSSEFGDVLDSDEKFTTSFDISRVKKIDVDVVSESVQLCVWDGNDIEVTIVSNLPESTRPKAYLEDSILKVKRSSSFQPLNFGIIRSSVTIKIPKAMAKSFSTGALELEIDTVSGSVLIEDIDAVKIASETTSGSIGIKDCRTEKIETETVSGSTRIENCITDKLDGNTTSGSFHFEGSCGNVEVDSVSGSVSFETDKDLTGSNEFKAVSGSIKILLSENNGFKLHYDTVSGRVVNDFTGLSGSKSGTDKYKSGDAEISIETVSGSASVVKR